MLEPRSPISSSPCRRKIWRRNRSASGTECITPRGVGMDVDPALSRRRPAPERAGPPGPWRKLVAWSEPNPETPPPPRRPVLEDGRRCRSAPRGRRGFAPGVDLRLRTGRRAGDREQEHKRRAEQAGVKATPDGVQVVGHEVRARRSNQSWSVGRNREEDRAGKRRRGVRTRRGSSRPSRPWSPAMDRDVHVLAHEPGTPPSLEHHLRP